MCTVINTVVFIYFTVQFELGLVSPKNQILEVFVLVAGVNEPLAKTPHACRDHHHLTVDVNVISNSLILTPS